MNEEPLTNDDLNEIAESKGEYTIDLDNLPKVRHRWIRRGVVVSCEGAGHPSHRHFLTQKREITIEPQDL